MQGFMKVVLIIVVFIVGGVALAFLKESRGGIGYGPLGVVIPLALFAGVRAIWNYDSKKTEENSSTDIDQLDKN
jgi:hypothetical protein